MCGIVGSFSLDGIQPEGIEIITKSMSDALTHRGPNDSGIYIDYDSGVALGHRRLSIIDLSPTGHQPMISACGRYVIVYNGELYNTEAVRAILARSGHCPSWRGHSDTEVLVEACAYWGIEDTLSQIDGIFAFALWDKKLCRLILVRDPLGVKPLYWAQFGSCILFGSELKALRPHPSFDPEIDRNALTAFMRHSFIPAPLSIYRAVRKLEAGTFLTVCKESTPKTKSYWSLAKIACNGYEDQLLVSDNEAINQLEELLIGAVSRQMVSDAPLGVFLSGGIDSSLVAALAQKASKKPVSTFTIGFHESGYNEAEHASRIAAHLGTQHSEEYISSSNAIDVIASIPYIFDEPFADPSQIPTYLLSKMTSNHVTVALAGDGGDELFAGYRRHYHGEYIAKFATYPCAIRKLLGYAFQKAPESALGERRAERFQRLSNMLLMKDTSVHRRLTGVWQNPSDIVLNASEPAEPFTPQLPILEQIQYHDMATFLPDDILVKTDRASMAASLEARVPLLDRQIVEFSWRLPRRLKLRRGRGKWLLRQVLYRHVPQQLIERPKMGFSVPLAAWLRGPLRDWAESLLDERVLREAGFFDPAPIRKMYRDHISGRNNNAERIWCVLMFSAWFDMQNSKQIKI